MISGLTSDYRIPLSDPRSDWLSYTGTLDVEETDTSYTESVRFGVDMGEVPLAREIDESAVEVPRPAVEGAAQLRAEAHRPRRIDQGVPQCMPD